MKPILFNTQMVRAIQKGQKTVTRRIAFEQANIRRFHINQHPHGWWFLGRVYATWNSMLREPQGVLSYAKYKAGDILYVRETWTKLYHVDENGYTHFDQEEIYYAADGDPGITLVNADGFEEDDQRIKWKPSIHMPKEAARIFLRVKEVRVERLNSMEEEDAIAEGFPDLGVDADSPLLRFSVLWDKTISRKDIGKFDWAANPWIFAYEFERISKEEAINEQ